jgi:hypothetical protein
LKGVDVHTDLFGPKLAHEAVIQASRVGGGVVPAITHEDGGHRFIEVR